jgi:hypothetical protein
MWKARANFGKGLKGFSMHDECDLRLDLRRDLRRDLGRDLRRDLP